MTTTDVPAAASDRDAPAPPPSRTARRLMVFLLLLIALMLVGYYAGLFKPRPKVALVTASQGAYWDLIIKGAQSAAERHKVNLAVVQSKGDEPSQTQAIRS